MSSNRNDPTSTDDGLDNLTELLSALDARLASLEARTTAGTRDVPPDQVDFVLLDRLQRRSGPEYEAEQRRGAVVAAITGRVGHNDFAWYRERGIPELLTGDPDRYVVLLAALGSPARLRLLLRLLEGPAQTRDLQEALAVSSVGQLYHHLKELQAAGLITQPRRSLYEIPQQKIPILLAILAAVDELGS